MLFAITKKSEIKEANNLLFGKLASLKHESYVINYGSAGGSTLIQILYSPKYNLWWGNSMEPNRFWNPFGLKKPKPNSTVTGRCQMNYSASEVDNNVAALLCKDAKGEIYLLHSGKVGGGQKGVGKNAFADYYTGRKTTVQFENQELEYYVVTGLNSKRFFQNIVDFVTVVYDFKDFVKSNRIAGTPIREKNPLKNGEYLGIKTYDLPPRVVTASNDHAVITTQLIQELADMGFKVRRDQFRDAYTVDSTKKIDRVFEIKSSLSRQSLYTAIGQLTLHSVVHNSKKFFVIATGINNELVEDLKKVQITCIFYKWQPDHKSVTFSGLVEL
jgi:hypothetical protein